MRAVVDGKLVRFPDHSRHPNLVLVEVQLAAIRGASQPRLTPELVWRMSVRRWDNFKEVLFLDGAGVVMSKAIHMLRRERLAFGSRYSSFVGRMLTGHDGLGAGTPVAGFSLVHPPATELVVARPEQVFPLPPRSDLQLASLALYGGLAVSAMERVGDDVVGVVGTGPLSRLLLRLLQARNIAVSSDATTWLVTHGAAHVPAVARRVIGCDVTEREIREITRCATEIEAYALDDLMVDENRVLDPFFEDGPCDYPTWLQPEHVRRYIESVGDLSEGYVPLPEERAGAGAHGRSRVQEFRFVRFPFTPHEDAVRDERLRGRTGVGLIGGGRWPLGMVIRQLVKRQEIALRGVCDRRPESAYLASQAMPFAYVTTDPDEILTDAATEAVVVAPYHGAHAGYAARALRAGKHCWVEKPPAVDEEQFKDLLDAATGSRRILYVGYNRRFAPATTEMMRALSLESGPFALNFVMRAIDIPLNNWYYWPSNGSRIVGNMCHLIDYALHVVGALPLSVTTITSEVGREDENAIVSLVFAEGSIATLLYTNRGRPRRGYFQHYLVARGRSIAEIRDFRRLTVRRSGRRIAAWRGPVDEGHRRHAAVFAEAIIGEGPAPVPLMDLFVSLRTVLAAEKSARLGRPVELQFDDLRDTCALRSE